MFDFQNLPQPAGGDRSRAPMVLAVLWAFASVVLVLLGARIFTRARLRILGCDDLLMVLATVLEIYFFVLKLRLTINRLLKWFTAAFQQ